MNLSRPKDNLICIKLVCIKENCPKDIYQTQSKVPISLIKYLTKGTFIVHRIRHKSQLAFHSNKKDPPKNHCEFLKLDCGSEIGHSKCIEVYSGIFEGLEVRVSTKGKKLLSHLAHYNSQLHFNEHNSSPLEKLSKFFRKLMQSISGSKVYNQVKYFLKYYLSINTINAKKICSQEETGENNKLLIRQHQNIK